MEHEKTMILAIIKRINNKILSGYIGIPWYVWKIRPETSDCFVGDTHGVQQYFFWHSSQILRSSRR